MRSNRPTGACAHLAAALAVALFAPPSAAQLAGTFTINPAWPASSANFTSLAAATAALGAQGVGGPVTLLLYDDAGPYTETATFTAASTGGTYGVPTGATPTAVLVMTSWTGASAVNRITFRAAPGEQPVLDATGKSVGVFWGGADYVTLQDIEIRNAAYDGISFYAEAVHGVALDPIVDGCRIHDIGGPAITIYGNTPQPTNTLIQNCTLWSCLTATGGPSPTVARFGYITTRRTNGTRIVHNTIYANTLPNNSSYCVFGSNPPSANEAPCAEFSNNVIVKLTATSAPLIRIVSPTATLFPTPVVCESNCYHNPSGSAFASWGVPPTVAATLTVWQQNALVDLTSIAADPLFRDPAGRDFHLLSGSPCRAVSAWPAGVPLDCDGQGRPAVQADLGADQFSNGTFALIGAGCPGTAGIAPAQRLIGWPFLGNQAFALGVQQAPPGSVTGLFGALGISPAPIPLGPCSIHLDAGSIVALAAAIAGPAGTAAVVLPVPAQAAFIGFRIGYQSLVLDPGAALGLSLTNAADVVFDF